MSDTIGGNSKAQLASFVDRIEALEADKKAISDDIRDIYSEAGGVGFDKKALREIIKIRKMDADKRASLEAMVDLYKESLGMLADLPLGVAAIERATKNA